ncbi:DUF3604 domain-containing protein [Bacteriovoracales bacterium]|nr:DUF3604 domain-containing protein [Bacteriovoracales bacterium]
MKGLVLQIIILGLLFGNRAFSDEVRRLKYTEEREKCRSYNPLKRPLFGDVHVHTSRSLDAATQDARTTPYQAYQFAKGKRMLLHPWLPKSKKGRAHPANSFLKSGTSFSEEPKFDASAQRSIQIGRPLDFAMVSDHAEFFGELRVCGDKKNYPRPYRSMTCRRLRKDLFAHGMSMIKRYLAGMNINSHMHNSKPLRRARLCGKKGEKCRKAAKIGWKEVIDAAEGSYDKSEDCKFTSFIGYEYTLSPLGTNLHRNVIFRNDKVPDIPYSVMEAKHPEVLWDKLIKNCLENETLKDSNGNGCDVIAIPHNSNMGGGRFFERKIRTIFNAEGKLQGDFNKDYAKKRIKMEPLIEVFQHKGDSECHYYKKGSLLKQAPIVSNSDEFCRFEKFPYNNLTADKENMFEKWFTGKLPFFFSTLSTYPAKSNFIRDSLKRGLQLETKIGVNPFKFGVIGSTDTHIGTPGATNETSFKGHGGAGAGNTKIEGKGVPYAKDGFPKEKNSRGLADFMSYGPGGLAVIWSEENSRDYIFDSMRKKETYGTSGTRIVLRFFGGWDYTEDEKKSLCKNVKFDPEGAGLTGGEFVSKGYEKGVPMGSDLKKRPSNASAPTFALAALRDPGHKTDGERKDVEERSTPLKVIQIIKGWVDSKGKSHEKVYNVSGKPDNGSSVNLNTCESEGPATNELCGFWTDPDFNPNEKSFYYARVMENPVCRWSWGQCVDFVKKERPNSTPKKYFQHHCSSKKNQKLIPEGFRECCLHKHLDKVNPKKWEKIQLGTYDATIHERAWSSPIWFNPEKK